MLSTCISMNMYKCIVFQLTQLQHASTHPEHANPVNDDPAHHPVQVSRVVHHHYGMLLIGKRDVTVCEYFNVVVCPAFKSPWDHCKGENKYLSLVPSLSPFSLFLLYHTKGFSLSLSCLFELTHHTSEDIQSWH